VWTLVAVLGAFALLTGTAVAHPERQAFFPDPNKGAVPGHGGHNKKPLIVCKSNSKRLIKKIFKGKKRRGKRLQRLGLYKRCRFHNIQTAVNHARSNDRIGAPPKAAAASASGAAVDAGSEAPRAAAATAWTEP